MCLAVVIVGAGIFFYLQTKPYRPEFKQIDINLYDDLEFPIKTLNITCDSYIGDTKYFHKWSPGQNYHKLTISASFDRNNFKRKSDKRIIAHFRENTNCVQILSHNSTFFPDPSIPSNLPYPIDFEESFEVIDSLRDNYVSLISHNPNDVVDSFTISGELFSSHEDNPYYHFHIKLHSLETADNIEGKVILRLTSYKYSDPTHSPLQIINVTPNRYTYTPYDGIIFDVKDVVENGGVYIYAEDMYKKSQMDRYTFIFTVLIGAAIAFLLDILVNLVIKWRNLAKTAKLPTPIVVKGFRPRR